MVGAHGRGTTSEVAAVDSPVAVLRSAPDAAAVSAPEELPVYDLIGGDRIAAMVAAFYRRVPTDPILGPMYPPDDMAGAEHRLRSFLIYRLGGPPDYLKERGHPRLRMRHMPFAIDRAARDRWMELMRGRDGGCRRPGRHSQLPRPVPRRHRDLPAEPAGLSRLRRLRGRHPGDSCGCCARSRTCASPHAGPHAVGWRHSS